MKGSGSDVNPETEVKLYAKEALYEERKQSCDIVKSQMLQIEDDMRKLTLAYSLGAAASEKLESKLKERQLACEGGAKELCQTTFLNQERLVDESVLKMRVHQLDEMFRKQKDKVFSLQKHMADLELAMNERIVDIKMQKELLRMQRKHCMEQLTQLRADIGERNLKIQALISRYDNSIVMLGKNEDGSIVTATQIKIETAQEKQILLRDGNELNEKVICAEKDIKAIENTLVLLNYSNETYKKTLEPVHDDSK